MADVKLTLDNKEVMHAFDGMLGPMKESLARRMLVSGGVMLRDAAKSNAAMSANKEGKEARGLIARAIKLTKTPEDDTPDRFNYRIYWDSKIAPHGHLIEFGHWMTHQVYKASNGEWYTLKDKPLATPKWVAARPFMRPTFDSYQYTAIRVMILRGAKELPILLKEHAAS